MSDPCTLLDWDSRHFGRSIARVNGDRLDESSWREIERWVDAHQVEGLYLLADADDPRTVAVAQRAGFLFVDVRVTLETGVLGPPQAAEPDWPNGVVIRRAEERDLDVLAPLAARSYVASRFYFDPNVETHLADGMYAIWLEKSVRGWAQQNLVAEVDGTPAGFVTGHGSMPTRARLGRRTPRPAGSRALVRASLSDFSANGKDRVAVVTQGRNIAAQRLYSRCGFLPRSVAWWFHKWIER